MEKICGIYKITSPSKKIYIGQSIDVNKRFLYYKQLKCKLQIKLYNSLKKYGWDKHKFEIICQCDKSELNNLEKYYVDLYKSFNSEFGLNLRDGGGSKGLQSVETKIKQSIAHKNISKETRLKMSLAKIKKPINFWLGKHRSEETKNKLRNHPNILNNKNSLGKKCSIETKEKMRKNRIGKKHTLATIEKMKKLKTGKNHNMYGIPKSDITKNKISKANLGKKRTIETINKMKLRIGNKNGFYGKHHTEETKQKMRKPKNKTNFKKKGEK